MFRPNAIRLSLLVVVALVAALPSQAGLKVYFLRHAQAGHNVAKEWADKPKEQWPAYVGNSSMLTPLGEQQVAAVPGKLAPYHFDFIAVSPVWRARQTVLPYLKAQKRTAEIWPELTEFAKVDAEAGLIGASGLPPPAEDVFTGGKVIELAAEDAEFFTLRTDGAVEVKRGRGGRAGAADVSLVLLRAIERVKSMAKSSETSVLLVGHGNSGRQLLRLLTGDDEMSAQLIDNTGLWMAEEQSDGSFKLVMANGKPVEEVRAALRAK
jgi:broad specificity phosphatase PhoE